MAHNRARLVAKAKTSSSRAKGPIHVFGHAAAEAPDRIKDFPPHPHVAAAGVPFDEDVALKIEAEDQLPRFNGGRPRRISRGGHDMSPGKVVRRECSHSILDPVRLRVAVTV